MKIIDENGRLFGKISVIDVLVIVVVLVMVIALMSRGAQKDATEEGLTPDDYVPITVQIQISGVRTYIGDALQVGDGLYEQGRDTNGAVGVITNIETMPGSSLAEMLDGTIVEAPMEDTQTLVLTVECEGLVRDSYYLINGMYELGVNAARAFNTKYVGFTGTVIDIY